MNNIIRSRVLRFVSFILFASAVDFAYQSRRLTGELLV